MRWPKIPENEHRGMWSIGTWSVAPLLVLLLAACGAPAPGNGAPDPTPTPGPGNEPLEHSCVTTLIAPLGPYSVRLSEPLPAGFDQANTGGCEFNHPVTTITLLLLRDGEEVLARPVELDEPRDDVGLPLHEGAAGNAPEDLPTGRYDYQLRATAVTGETVTLVDREFWVFRAEGTPEDLARRDLAERLDVDPGELILVDYTHQEWPDAGLGCPEPGHAYAQVVTPGFRVVLAHGEDRYAYHSNEDATVIRLCRDPE